nr:hypothetical protein CFP56_22349 [Quercus suber]
MNRPLACSMCCLVVVSLHTRIAALLIAQFIGSATKRFDLPWTVYTNINHTRFISRSRRSGGQPLRVTDAATTQMLHNTSPVLLTY